MSARYINPYTDFGFKKIFGEEASKPLLIDFLNSMLPEYHQIAKLDFKNTEQLGISGEDRKAVYDIYCENEKGEKFIVELQKVKQKFFKERTLFYTTYPIREQGERGDWDYSLTAVYCIAVLNFTFDDTQQNNDVVHTVQLKNQRNQVFYDKLTFIYLEMPKFDKTEDELTTQLDKWLYFIKNLDELQDMPTIFKDSEIFDRAFDKAELANFNRQERNLYESSLKQYRDLKSALLTSREEGRKEGIEEGIEKGIEKEKLETITRLLSIGASEELMQQASGLSLQEVRKLVELLRKDK